MVSFEEFSQNLRLLKERVESACASCGRSVSEVKILPVTKNHPADAALFALRAGIAAVGENRVQEAEQKIPQASGLQWELIGHLQSNKAKKAAELFGRIQSLDSVRLAQKLDSAAAALGKKLRVLLQINAGRDPAKFGAEIEEAPALLEAVLKSQNLKVEGLMTIAPLDENLDSASRAFANLRNLRDKLGADFGAELGELSMGMSGDLERAIAEGSTLIRVGTFLYGQRIYV
ncbi:MAG: YggS family pyridoxal phosphate-dependent enzyme [Opitutales bacterium]|nr:YggS family pyridoxal phosphate-dependent enzyme [Opitutales bacterium]